MTNYRPQWVYYTPPGFRDEAFRYVVSFDLVANGTLQANFPVQLDDDAPFVLRGFWFPVLASIQVETRIRDPWGNYLQSDLCLLGGGMLTRSGSRPFPCDAEIIAPAGAIFQFDFFPSDDGEDTAFTYRGELHGVKRYPMECAK